MDSKCNRCKHYGFYQMIQSPYSYQGEIPCLTCSRFSQTTDNFEPINSFKFVSGDTGDDGCSVQNMVCACGCQIKRIL